MNSFQIETNRFLNKPSIGYYHQLYTGYNNPGNPNFLNILKNTFNNESLEAILDASNEVIKILTSEIPNIMKERNIEECVLICVPRAKALDTYYRPQLGFLDSVKIAARKIHGAADGTKYLVRVINTQTTHLKQAAIRNQIENDGKGPYPGITKNTCCIAVDKIKGKDIILIDDIYTKNVNIDEDCIQAIMDSGAREVIFFAIGYSRRV